MALVLHSSWPGTTVCLSTATPTGAAVSVDSESAVASGWVACSAAATGEQADTAAADGSAPAYGLAVGSSGDACVVASYVTASGAAVSSQTDYSCATVPAVFVVSGRMVDLQWSASCVSGIALATGTAVGESSEAATVFRPTGTPRIILAAWYYPTVLLADVIQPCLLARHDTLAMRASA